MQETMFRQWHDEDSTFHWQKYIDFSLARPGGNMHLHELLKLTSDGAVEDYNKRNMSRESLAEKNVAILVSRNSFRFHRFPRENERVELVTWEEKSEPLQLMRAYEIKSENGEKLVSGISGWLVVDFKERRIIPTKRFTLRPEPVLSREHNCLPCGKISVTEEMKSREIFLGERKVGMSDLDANGHTNNARYIAFVVDFLPAEYSDKIWKDLRINYSKEAVLGQTLKLFGYPDENKITVVGKTEEGTSFEAELYF